MPLRRGSDAISPTAHYTGHVWVRNGLAPSEFASWQGQALFASLRPAVALSRSLGGPTLEGLLLSRHRVIDALLEEAIADGRVSQVVEPACGMSGRGWRFAERFADKLTYIEADLPRMAERKRDALGRVGSLTDRHRVAEVDVVLDGGGGSLAALADTLDRDQGLAIVTEGLLTYFDQDSVLGMWRRFAEVLARFRSGIYLADLRLGSGRSGAPDRAFEVLLSTFVRGKVHTNFANEIEAKAALRSSGFTDARLHRCDQHPAAGDARADPGAGRLEVVDAAASAIPTP